MRQGICDKRTDASDKTELFMKKRGTISKLLACGCLVAALCVPVCGCELFNYGDEGKDVPLSTPLPVEYKMYEVVKDTIKPELEDICKVQSGGGVAHTYEYANLPLERYEVMPGQHVEKGDVLAVLRTDAAESRIEELEAQEGGWGAFWGVSGSDEVRNAVEHKELKAKVSGTVRYVNTSYIGDYRKPNENYVTAGDTMVIIDAENLKNSQGVMVLYEHVARKFTIEEGTTLKLYTAETNTEFAGEVLYKVKTNNWNSETITYYISLANAPGEVKVGDTLKVKYTEGEEKQAVDVPVVPLSAVYTYEGRSFVYILDEDGKKRECYIEVGLSDDTKVEVKDGLKEGDKIIYY